jgi:hypothetical protein
MHGWAPFCVTAAPRAAGASCAPPHRRSVCESHPSTQAPKRARAPLLRLLSAPLRAVWRVQVGRRVNGERDSVWGLNGAFEAVVNGFQASEGSKAPGHEQAARKGESGMRWSFHEVLERTADMITERTWFSV